MPRCRSGPLVTTTVPTRIIVTGTHPTLGKPWSQRVRPAQARTGTSDGTHPIDLASYKEGGSIPSGDSAPLLSPPRVLSGDVPACLTATVPPDGPKGPEERRSSPAGTTRVPPKATRPVLIATGASSGSHGTSLAPLELGVWCPSLRRPDVNYLC